MAALVGMQPLVDFGIADPAMGIAMLPGRPPFFSAGASVLREKRRDGHRRNGARLVRCTATHSTALHMDAEEWSPWSGL